MNRVLDIPTYAICKNIVEKKIIESSSLVIDRSLTKDGQVANAKTVGDRFDGVALFVENNNDGYVTISVLA